MKDAIDQARIIRYSLMEAFAHVQWFREDSPKATAPYEAVFWGRYYLDNAVLRMYPLWEDLAAFVVQLLKIQPEDLQSYRERRSSEASTVGMYLKNECPGDPVTRVIEQAIQDDDIKKMLKYRNTWVHEQPPRFKGLSI